MSCFPANVRRAAGVLLCFLASGGTVAQIPDGFLDLAWGTPLEAVRQRYPLRPLAAGPRHERFAVSIPAVGGAVVDECQFEFFGGRLSGVVLLTRGRGNTRALLQYLQKRYGPGIRESDRACQWFSAKTHFAYDEDSAGDGYIYGYSVEYQEAPE
jgi:hypothetical protein